MTRSILRASLLLMAITFLPYWPAKGQSVELIANPSDPHFGSLRLADTNSRQLLVYPEELWEKKTGKLPAMFGQSKIVENMLVFTPRFPFVQGKKYVVCRVPNCRDPEFIQIPNFQWPEPVSVLCVFPSLQEVPANLLKIHIWFSGPMSNADVYQHLQLLDESGQEVLRPFLMIDPPLWDQNRQRLTLWFDPGRIKRHLLPNRKEGPPLLPGQQYEFRISGDWQDANGQPIEKGYQKVFRTLAPDRNMPTPAQWEVVPPKSQTRNHLLVKFQEPMDRGMLESALAVFDPGGKVVSGTIETGPGETSWSFIPEREWMAGEYELRLSQRLEDLAGNNLKRLFDTDAEASTAPGGNQTAPPVALRITIR